MLKLIDSLLYGIIEFFQRKSLFTVWFTSFAVINFGFYYYEIGNGYEVTIYWYDVVSLLFFILTYLRAKFILNKIE